jgi:hypothetical protein
MNERHWTVRCRDFTGCQRIVHVVLRGSEVVIVAPPGESAVLDCGEAALFCRTIAMATRVAAVVKYRAAMISRSAGQMSRSRRTVPAAALLRRLGWHHLRVTCRDAGDKAGALHLRRRAANLIEVEFSAGSVARLTNVEAGRLRAALREVLVDDLRSHHVGVSQRAVR